MRTKVGKAYSILSHTSPPDSSIPTKISGALSILASYDGSFDDVFFTVNVFCGANLKVWWDEEAGIGNSISRGGGFSTKVHLGVRTTLCITERSSCHLFDRSTARSQPRTRAGIIRIRRTCSTRNGTFVSMTTMLGRVGVVYSPLMEMRRL